MAVYLPIRDPAAARDGLIGVEDPNIFSISINIGCFSCTIRAHIHRWLGRAIIQLDHIYIAQRDEMMIRIPLGSIMGLLGGATVLPLFTAQSNAGLLTYLITGAETTLPIIMASYLFSALPDSYWITSATGCFAGAITAGVVALHPLSADPFLSLQSLGTLSLSTGVGAIAAAVAGAVEAFFG